VFEGPHFDRSAIRLSICRYPIHSLSLQGFATEPIWGVGASRPCES